MDEGQEPWREAQEPVQDEDRRPTPVRMVMEGTDHEGSGGEDREREFVDPETGEAWVVAVVGRAVSGILPLRTVPLMELDFFRPGESRTPARRAVCKGEDLSGLTDSELLTVLQGSEPYRDPHDPEKKSTEDRRRPGRNRRNLGG